MVVEWYLRVEYAKIKPKNNIKAKQKSSMPNSLKKAKKGPKCQTKNFKAKRPQKRPNLTYLALRKAKWQPCLPPPPSRKLRLLQVPKHGAGEISNLYIRNRKLM